MIGIREIAGYICSHRALNIEKTHKDKDIDDDFLQNKLGIVSTAYKKDDETVLSMCVEAFKSLQLKTGLDISEVDCLCLCSQTGDYVVPHNSAVLQDILGVSKNAAVFDVYMGCAGFVYSLDITKHFMESNNMKKGLLFNCDILSPNVDKRSDLVFGDAASCTLLTNDPVFTLGKPAYCSMGSMYSALMVKKDGTFNLNNIPIFSFIMGNVPDLINRSLELNSLSFQDIDIFAMQQTGKHILDNLTRRMKLAPDRVPFVATDYGNTSSSSLPLILEKYLKNININTILLTGFGEGLSATSMPVYRRK